MSKSTYSFQIDDNIKTQFDELCEEFGMDGATAFNIFAKAVVRKQKIPFDIGKDEDEFSLEEGRKVFNEIRRIAKENGTMGMSLEEINEEIRKARYGED